MSEGLDRLRVQEMLHHDAAVPSFVDFILNRRIFILKRSPRLTIVMHGAGSDQVARVTQSPARPPVLRATCLIDL